jgi:hypothetical protein
MRYEGHVNAISISLWARVRMHSVSDLCENFHCLKERENDDDFMTLLCDAH